MKPLTVLSMLVLSLAACGSPDSGGTLVLDDFESRSSLERWEGPVSISREYAAHGKFCLELDLHDRRRRILKSESLPPDLAGRGVGQEVDALDDG